MPLGPIYWFAEASQRSGGDRFASLTGSLTSYGIFVGVAVLAAFMFFKGVQRALVVAMLITGAILSLQKAGLANIALGFFLAFWIGALHFRGV